MSMNLLNGDLLPFFHCMATQNRLGKPTLEMVGDLVSKETVLRRWESETLK